MTKKYFVLTALAIVVAGSLPLISYSKGGGGASGGAPSGNAPVSNTSGTNGGNSGGAWGGSSFGSGCNFGGGCNPDHRHECNNGGNNDNSNTNVNQNVNQNTNQNVNANVNTNVNTNQNQNTNANINAVTVSNTNNVNTTVNVPNPTTPTTPTTPAATPTPTPTPTATTTPAATPTPLTINNFPSIFGGGGGIGGGGFVEPAFRFAPGVTNNEVPGPMEVIRLSSPMQPTVIGVRDIMSNGHIQRVSGALVVERVEPFEQEISQQPLTQRSLASVIPHHSHKHRTSHHSH